MLTSYIASKCCLSTGVDAQELYNFSCSALKAEENHYVSPDLMKGTPREIVPSFLTLLVLQLSDNDINIYPVPSPLNCSGTVLSLEHCYFGGMEDILYGRDNLLFTLLILEQDGLTFRITDTIDVHGTPTSEKCLDRFSWRVCCDSFVLENMNHSLLPTSSFAFGIVPSSVARLVRYTGADAPSFTAEQYNLPSFALNRQAIGETITVRRNDRSTLPVLYFQFVISKPIFTTCCCKFTPTMPYNSSFNVLWLD